MARLLLFVPCERVIVSREGTISLITILENININIPENQEGLPEDAVIPISWHVATIWQRADHTEARKFEQRIQLVLPDGRIPTDAVIEVDLSTNTQMHTITEVAGFPISRAGTCAVILSLRPADAGHEWQEIARYPLTIKRVGENPA